MTYPGGGPGGYPGPGPQQPPQGPGYGPPPPKANLLAGMTLPVLLALGVTLLGVVGYFCGFSDEAQAASLDVRLMLLAGLLAAFRAVPNGPRYFPVAAVIAVLAGLSLLDTVIGISETSGIVVVLLIIGILQMAAAVVALLFDLGVLKVPAPRHSQQEQWHPQQEQYGPPPGQYGPPGQYPQPGQQPGQQTTFQPQHGQFGQPGQNYPGTPPGGYPPQGG